MAIVDYAVIVILILFFVKGYKSGFLGMLGWLVGLLVGIWIAGQYYLQVGDWLAQYIKTQIIALGLGYIIVLVLVMAIVGIIFWVLNRIFNFLPVIGFFNKILGGVLGLIEAIIILGIVFWLVVAVPFSNPVVDSINKAQLRQPIVNMTAVIRGMLPESLKALAEVGQSLKVNNIDFNNFDPNNINWNNVDPSKINFAALPDAAIKDFASQFSEEQITEFMKKLSPQQAADLRIKLSQ